MKHSLIIIFCLCSLLTSFASCDKDNSKPGNPDNENTNGNKNPNPAGIKMKIKIGASTFTATLYDNATARAFKALLPITVNMSELNGNEKYFDLAASLPTNASNPGTIQNGDLMLYGSKTLVLFYKSFSTSYNYTKLGRLNDAAGLAAALGSGNVTVTFELE
jgi:hypothetical protein